MSYSEAVKLIFGILISYLIGSIPTSYIFGRVLKGIDIRNFGSGNVGATNAFRILGKVPGIVVLILDILKGFFTVTFIGNIFVPNISLISEELVRLIFGLSCISGHNWTIFLKFRGGKGVASTFGVLIGLAVVVAPLRLILGLLILAWLMTFLISRTVSIASIVSALVLPIFLVLLKQSKELIITGVIFSIFIIYRHKSNIIKIKQGKEKKLF